MEVKARAREHLEKHRDIYIGIGIGAALVGITWVIVRSKQNVTVFKDVCTGDTVTQKDTPGFSFSQISGRDINNIVTVQERVGRGHPGYLTWCEEHQTAWPTQGDASAAHGATPRAMSLHLNEKISDINGHHLKRIAMAA